MNEPNDERLMQLLLAAHDAGDETACHRNFEELYRRHNGAAYNLALHVTGSAELAEEVLQSAMIRVWKYLRGYNPAKGTVRSWLLRIVARTSLTVAAERKRRVSEASGGLALVEAAAEPFERPEQTAARMEMLATLRGVLERLPALERRMLALYYGGGLSQEEIASQLAMPKRTVSHRIQRALEQLRAELVGMGLATSLPLVGAEGLGEAFTVGGAPPVTAGQEIVAQALRTPIEPAGAALEASRRVAGAAGWSGSAWAGAVLASVCVAVAGTVYMYEQGSGSAIATTSVAQDKGAQAEPASAKSGEVGETAPAAHTALGPSPEFAGLPARWNFEKEQGQGLRVVAGAWNWMVDPLRKTGCMVPTGAEGVVVEPQVALPQGPVRIRMRYRMAKAGALKFACYLMDDKASFVAHQVWRNPVEMGSLSTADLMQLRTMEYYVFERYVVSFDDGTPWCVRVYEQPYASGRFAFILMNTAVFEIDVCTVEPEDLPVQMRDMAKLITELSQGPVQVRADGMQMPPGAKTPVQ